MSIYMTPEYASLAKHSKDSPTKMGKFGYNFSLITLDELRMFLSVTSEKNPLIALDLFVNELRYL